MVQRYQALSAKKWFVRDNPKSTGYTMDDLSSMSVKTLAKNMIGYTANIPGTRASKAQLRREILTMVKQIEIETASGIGASLGARSKSAEKKTGRCIHGRGCAILVWNSDISALHLGRHHPHYRRGGRH
jgi:hypothetical protein